MEELQLPPRWRGIAGEFELEVLHGFAESGAGRDGGPETGMMRADIPRGGAAHAEAAVQNAVFVDGVLALHGVERFEEIHLAGEAAGIAEAAIEMQHDGIARRKFAQVALTV